MTGLIKWTISSLTLVSAAIASAQTYTRDDVPRLQQGCQSARHVAIEPLKQEEIDKCVATKRGDREWCEKDLEYFGEAAGRKPGMFWDLPECELAFEVERYFQRYPGKDSYTP